MNRQQRILIRAYEKALRSEYYFDRLSIDERFELKTTAQAVGCAEERSDLVSSLRDDILDEGLDLPQQEKSYQLREGWILGTEELEIDTFEHLSDCMNADSSTISALRALDRLDWVERLSDSGRKFFGFVGENCQGSNRVVSKNRVFGADEGDTEDPTPPTPEIAV